MKRENFKVEIFGEMWDVKYVSNIRHYGYCDKEKKEILINTKYSKKMIVVSLIHELFHAYCSRCGIENAISHEVEEILADQFATVMAENFEFPNI